LANNSLRQIALLSSASRSVIRWAQVLPNDPFL
jgi:hypothetical protein